MFSVNLKNSYYALNNPMATDSEIETIVNQIVNSLFSVLVTMSTIPIIRCSRGNAAEMIATKLDARLRDHLMNTRHNLFQDMSSSSNSVVSFTRPILVILDRNMDLSSMVAHGWSYSALVHDVLDMRANRVAVFDEESGRKTRKVYDIDVNDFFWSKNFGNPFPQVAEDVDFEINRYKKDVEEVTRSAGVSSLDQVDPK